MDRTVDALVATHLMGLRVVAMDWPCGYWPDDGHYGAAHRADEHGQPVDVAEWFTDRGPVYLYRDDEPWPPTRINELNGNRYAAVEPVPFYSSEWRAMKHVVDAMRARGFYFEMGDRFGDDGEHPHAYYVSFEPLAVRLEREQVGWLDQPDEQWWRYATTAPMAVCRAALAALGVEVE